MTHSKLLAGAAALALLVAAPSASFAFPHGGGGGGHVGGGGGHFGGGGGAHFSGGGMHVGGGAPMGGGHFTAAPAPRANFAAAPATRSFAATAPAARVGASTGWTSGRTAWNGGWRGDGFHHHRHFFPGAFAAGAVIGGALAADSYAYYGGPDYYYGPDYYADDTTYYDAGPEVAVVQGGGGDVAYCEQRFKSYDPASGTYLGYDGLRHPCP